MRFALVLLVAFVISISHQQLQRSRILPWLTSYSSYINKYQPLYYDDVVHHDIPLFRYSRPVRPTSSYIYSLQNEDFNNQGFGLSEESQQDNSVEMSDGQDEIQDTQSRINRFKGYNNQNAAGRFFYGTTINNPFYKTATFTVSSTVTTLGSIIFCVPSNNLAAVPSPTCAGRKKREVEDSEDNQFPIAPSETLALVPTLILSSNKDAVEGPHHQQLPHHLISSKDEGVPSTELLEVSPIEDHQTNSFREKRFFGSGIAASTTLTRYSFVGATLTSTVILDSTAQNVAQCLPAGYVVCA